MKKLSILVLTSILIIACQKEELPIDEIMRQLPPIQATELDTKISGNGINLFWVDNSTNESGFKIERKSNNGQYTIIATLSKDITSYRDSSIFEYKKYTYRVYPFNSSGPSLSYSNEASNILIKTVKIGNQIWASTNLDVSTYSDGTPIPEIKDSLAWAKAKGGAWCWYRNDSLNYSHLGKLYNWYAVNDKRGLAPEGYHVASDNEWKILTNMLGGEIDCVKKIKSTSGWYSGNFSSTVNGVQTTKFINGNGNNSSGLNIIGSGYRAVSFEPTNPSTPRSSSFVGTTFPKDQLGIGSIWTKDEHVIPNNPLFDRDARIKNIMWYYSDHSTMSNSLGISSVRPKSFGMNVRIIKD